VGTVLLTPVGAHINNSVRHVFKHVRNKVAYQKVVGNTATINSGEEANVRASCPGKKKVVGGGYQSSGSAPGEVVIAQTSKPTANNRAWKVRAGNFGGNPQTVFAIAICARL
jgi:hypothetical protein